MNRLLQCLAFILPALSVALPATAQSVESLDGTVDAVFRADPTTPLVGEPVQLQLTVVVPSGFEIVEWPELPAEWQDFSVTDTSEVLTDTSSDGAQTIWQGWTIRLWQPDDYETPETFIGYLTPNSDEVRRIPVRPVFFTVESILDSDDLNLRPPRPPARFIYVPPWAVGLILIAGTVAIYTSWERLKTHRQMRPLEPEVELSPAQIADHQLAAIVYFPSRYGQLGAVSDAIRQFIDTRFNLDTLSQSPEEVYNNSSLRGYLRETEWQALIRMLTELDQLRFAPTPVDDSLIRRYIEAARHWVATVDLSSRGEAA